MDNPFSAQLQYGLNSLMSPAGAIAVFCWVVLLIGILVNPKVKWWALVGMLWCSVMGFFVQDHKASTLAFPLEALRNNGRPLTTGLLAALLLLTFFVPRGWRTRVLGLPLIFYFVFQALLSIRIVIAGVADRGMVSIVIYAMMFIALGAGCGKWMQSWEDVHKILRCIVGAAGLNVIATIYQLAISKSAAISSGRLAGTCGNPQEMALVLAATLPVAVYLSARATEPKLSRIFSGFVGGVSIVMVIWTGSRTGVLVSAIGIIAIFWSRLGRFVLIGSVIALVAFLAFQVYSESTMTLAGMLQRGNTRSQVWRAMWEAFLSQPALGIMNGVYGTAESSYLSVASQAGLYGLVPLTAFLMSVGYGSARLLRLRSLLGPEKNLVDLIVGGLVSLLIGALFEAYLMGTLVIPVFVIMLYLAIMTFIIDAVTTAQRHAQFAEPAAEMLGGFDQPQSGYGAQVLEQYT